MKIVIMVALLMIVSQSVPSSAAYIHADKRPLNIAHRGLCSILPQNTLEAFEAALYQGADFIELDVVYTRQKELLVMHDPFLTRITNIKSHPEFASRFETREYNGAAKLDWWTDTFSLAQLRRLGIKQAQAPGRISVFDFKFTFPLLSDVLEMVANFNRQHKGKRNPDGRLAGILIEAKDSQMYRDLYAGLEIGQSILALLRKYNVDTIAKAQIVSPIYLHSFDYDTVKYWAAHSELPRNYLVYSGETLQLEDVAKYANGVGFEEGVLWDYATARPNAVWVKARQLGLLLHIWTFKDDVLFLNASTNLASYFVAQSTLQLDGVITEFSDIYAPLAQIYRSQLHPGYSFQTNNQSIPLSHILEPIQSKSRTAIGMAQILKIENNKKTSEDRNPN